MSHQPRYAWQDCCENTVSGPPYLHVKGGFSLRFWWFCSESSPGIHTQTDPPTPSNQSTAVAKQQQLSWNVHQEQQKQPLGGTATCRPISAPLTHCRSHELMKTKAWRRYELVLRRNSLPLFPLQPRGFSRKKRGRNNRATDPPGPAA